MPDLLLTLVMPENIAQQVEDLLLDSPGLVRGFTASPAQGHGNTIELVEPDELVSGHSPRIQIQTVGPEGQMREILALIKTGLPRARVFYWLVPVIEMGRL